jgi:hypothetical protein
LREFLWYNSVISLSFSSPFSSSYSSSSFFFLSSSIFAKESPQGPVGAYQRPHWVKSTPDSDIVPEHPYLRVPSPLGLVTSDPRHKPVTRDTNASRVRPDFVRTCPPNSPSPSLSLLPVSLPPRALTFQTMPLSSQFELCQLYPDLDARALIRRRATCQYALALTGSQVISHLRDKHRVPEEYRKGFTAYIRHHPIEFRDLVGYSSTPGQLRGAPRAPNP